MDNVQYVMGNYSDKKRRQKGLGRWASHRSLNNTTSKKRYKKKVREMPYKVSETPGSGRYECLSCGYEIYLEFDHDLLPPCAKCERGEFIKKLP
ncbi:MAG: hypothetical protein ACE5HY_01675 [Candidatus Hydrothermarchaeales archaeon]